MSEGKVKSVVIVRRASFGQSECSLVSVSCLPAAPDIDGEYMELTSSSKSS